MKELLNLIVVSLTLLSCQSESVSSQKALLGKSDAPLSAYLSKAELTEAQVFKSGRFPNIVTTPKGTVLAFYYKKSKEGMNVFVRRSSDAGKTWGETLEVGQGFMGGGVTVNDVNGDIFAFLEKGHPPSPLFVYKSADDGLTWSKVEIDLKEDVNGETPDMHMNERGITLRYGKYAGRMIRPTREYTKGNYTGGKKYWPKHYTNAIYSDDNGKTWIPCKPFSDGGTGEAALVELSDGSIYYNSRAHWYKDAKNDPPLQRRDAISIDGGQTFTGWKIQRALPDGAQNSTYGCMAGLVRIPIEGKDVLVYTNCDSDKGRKLGTAWVSFDGGKSWPLKRLMNNGAFAYSSAVAGRPGTASEGWIYCLAEGGGAKVYRFNLKWLLGGVETGNGSIPAWAKELK